MRKETMVTNIKLVEFRESDKHWVVRWDIRPKLDENGNETGAYRYEEEAYNFIPTIEDIQQTIIDWFNKQTDGVIKHGFRWKGMRVLLNDENKFNYKAITDEAARRETAIAIWDKEHPELAGVYHIFEKGVDKDGNEIQIPIPTGRPASLLPVTLKLDEINLPENFYVFTTLGELQDFFAKGVDHLLAAYAAGWKEIAAFDWQPYILAIEQL